MSGLRGLINYAINLWREEGVYLTNLEFMTSGCYFLMGIGNLTVSEREEKSIPHIAKEFQRPLLLIDQHLTTKSEVFQSHRRFQDDIVLSAQK